MDMMGCRNMCLISQCSIDNTRHEVCNRANGMTQAMPSGAAPNNDIMSEWPQNDGTTRIEFAGCTIQTKHSQQKGLTAQTMDERMLSETEENELHSPREEKSDGGQFDSWS
eukprot:2429195-Amphidinium_carterae.5